MSAADCQRDPAESPRHDDEDVATVRRTCRWCGRKFTTRRGEGGRRGRHECEPPLIPRDETVKR